MKTPNIIAQVLERMLPVGSIVEWAPVDGDSTDLSTPEQVAAYYGFGVWQAYGGGRMLLGVSDAYPEGNTGGQSKVTLTAQQIPKFSGSIYAGAGTSGPTGNGWGAFREGSGIFSTHLEMENGQPTVDSSTKFPSGSAWAYADLAFGGGESHENMPPYITVYRWQRIK